MRRVNLLYIYRKLVCMQVGELCRLSAEIEGNIQGPAPVSTLCVPIRDTNGLLNIHSSTRSDQGGKCNIGSSNRVLSIRGNAKYTDMYCPHSQFWILVRIICGLPTYSGLFV